eukprot:6479570-Amphidinium_carterae.3
MLPSTQEFLLAMAALTEKMNDADCRNLVTEPLALLKKRYTPSALTDILLNHGPDLLKCSSSLEKQIVRIQAVTRAQIL